MSSYDLGLVCICMGFWTSSDSISPDLLSAADWTLPPPLPPPLPLPPFFESTIGFGASAANGRTTFVKNKIR